MDYTYGNKDCSPGQVRGPCSFPTWQCDGLTTMQQNFHTGDPVIYRMTKLSSKPGRRAQDVAPAVKGEYYSYEVDKFWTVAEMRPDGKVLLRTRRGKEHVLSADNPRLRHACWWERLFYRHRFPQLEQHPPSHSAFAS